MFKEGKTDESRRLINRGLLASSSIKSFRTPFPECRGNILIRENRDGATACFPEKITLPDTVPVRTICRGKDNGMMAYGGSKRILLTDKNGRTAQEHQFDDGTEPVSVCLWSRDTVVFYRGDSVYRMNPENGAVRALIPEQQFPPPFSKAKFTVSFSLDGTMLAIAVGIAGSYNLYGLDLRSSSSLFTRRSCSSSRILVDRGTFYYITGSAGSWTLSSYNPTGNKQKDLRSFASLLDIEMVPGFLLFESHDGTIISDMASQDDIPLPFSLRLAGQCDGLVMGEVDERLHLFNVETLFTKCRAVRMEIPEFFKAKQP